MTTNLVLIHGLNSTGTIWEGVRTLLPRDIAVDAPTCPPLESVDAIAEHLIASLPDKFHLLGYSFGGYVALALLELYPSRVQSLILTATSAFADSPARQGFRRDCISLAQQRGLVEFCMEQYQKAVFGEGSALEGDTYDSVGGLYAREIERYGFARYRAHQLASASRPDRNAILASATVPTLLIRGEEDNVVPLRLQEQSIAHCQDGKTITIPRTGHLLVLEDPAAFTSALCQWLEACSHKIDGKSAD